MSTHRSENMRVNKRNKKILASLRDSMGLGSHDDSITLLILAAPIKVSKKKDYIDDLFDDCDFFI